MNSSSRTTTPTRTTCGIGGTTAPEFPILRATTTSAQNRKTGTTTAGATPATTVRSTEAGHSATSVQPNSPATGPSASASTRPQFGRPPTKDDRHLPSVPISRIHLYKISVLWRTEGKIIKILQYNVGVFFVFNLPLLNPPLIKGRKTNHQLVHARTNTVRNPPPRRGSPPTSQSEGGGSC